MATRYDLAMSDELEPLANSLKDLMLRGMLKHCPQCKRPRAVCDADYCAERLKLTCPECRGTGVFHADTCSRRQRR